MIKWADVLRLADKGNHKPDRVIAKTDEAWRAQLTPEQYNITRQRGTERAFQLGNVRFVRTRIICLCVL